VLEDSSTLRDRRERAADPSSPHHQNSHPRQFDANGGVGTSHASATGAPLWSRRG
jgi:hypothetical protein